MGKRRLTEPIVIPENADGKYKHMYMRISRNFQLLDDGLGSTEEQLSLLNGIGMNHNLLYRGKNLGTIDADNIDAFCEEHETATGKFTGLYLGDYFVIEDGTYNKEWMIAGFDVDYGKRTTADTAFLDTHMMTLIPRAHGITTGRMHSSDSTDGGYYNSEIRTTVNDIGDILATVLGDHMKTGWAFVSTRATSGVVDRISCGLMRIQLLNACEVFGYQSSIASDFSDIGGEKILPIFRNMNTACADADKGEYWFENVCDSTRFLYASYMGSTLGRATATSVKLIRPKIFIG